VLAEFGHAIIVFFSRRKKREDAHDAGRKREEGRGGPDCLRVRLSMSFVSVVALQRKRKNSGAGRKTSPGLRCSDLSGLYRPEGGEEKGGGIRAALKKGGKKNWRCLSLSVYHNLFLNREQKKEEGEGFLLRNGRRKEKREGEQRESTFLPFE